MAKKSEKKDLGEALEEIRQRFGEGAIMKLKEVIEERKMILACSIIKDTRHESVARNAFDYCTESKLPDEIKARILKGEIGKIKFKPVKKQIEKWLKEHGH